MSNSAGSPEEVLRSLVPSCVVVTGTDQTWEALALSEEHGLTGNMVEKRRREFLTGRSCARRGLRELGFEDEPLLPNSSRAPDWPPGATGSISHTQGYCIAAVAPSTDLKGVGIDVERRDRLHERLHSRIASPVELERFEEIEDWDTILFSAKEAIYKCLNPLTGVWLDFHDVELLQLGGSRFVAVVCWPKRQPLRIEGAYGVSGTFVVSVVVLSEVPP